MLILKNQLMNISSKKNSHFTNAGRTIINSGACKFSEFACIYANVKFTFKHQFAHGLINLLVFSFSNVPQASIHC